MRQRSSGNERLVIPIASASNPNRKERGQWGTAGKSRSQPANLKGLSRTLSTLSQSTHLYLSYFHITCSSPLLSYLLSLLSVISPLSSLTSLISPLFLSFLKDTRHRLGTGHPHQLHGRAKASEPSRAAEKQREQMPSKKIEIFPRKSQLPELPRLRTSHSSGLPWLPRIRTPSSAQLEHRIADRQVREVLCLYACWKPGPGPGRFACDESFKPTRTRNTRTRLTRLAEGARPAAEQDFLHFPRRLSLGSKLMQLRSLKALWPSPFPPRAAEWSSRAFSSFDRALELPRFRRQFRHACAHRFFSGLTRLSSLYKAENTDVGGLQALGIRSSWSREETGT